MKEVIGFGELWSARRTRRCRMHAFCPPMNMQSTTTTGSTGTCTIDHSMIHYFHTSMLYLVNLLLSLFNVLPAKTITLYTAMRSEFRSGCYSNIFQTLLCAHNKSVSSPTHLRTHHVIVDRKLGLIDKYRYGCTNISESFIYTKHFTNDCMHVKMTISYTTNFTVRYEGCQSKTRRKH